MSGQNLNSEEQANIDKAIKLGTHISVTLRLYNTSAKAKLENLLAYYLEKINQAQLKDYAVYCLNELATNANKANTKRVYFLDHGLDIMNPVQYKMGLETFKKETLENIDRYLERQKEEGFYVKVLMQGKGNRFYMEVRNNAVLTSQELTRINQKINLAKNMSDMAEAMTSAMDDSEGAGLGVIIMHLMLKQIGADKDAYSIDSTQNETIAKLRLPFSASYIHTISDLSDKIIQHINHIPQFPQKILELQKLINDSDTEMTDIAKHISNDVGITTDLLKLVNSAAFGLKATCSNIADAVKLVGIRGVQNLLYSIGTVNIFAREEKSDEKQALWMHSYKVAYFAYNLARMLKIKAIIDDAYVCGLLHDVGKLVVSDMYPEVQNAIVRFQKEQNVPKQIIDMVNAGIHHSEIGAKLTQKWNFPPQISASILYHHNLTLAPKEYFQIAATVAMANFMVHYSEGTVAFDEIPQEILKAFKIENEAVIKKIAANFSDGFAQGT